MSEVKIKELDKSLIHQANSNSMSGQRGDISAHEYEVYCQKVMSWNMAKAKVKTLLGTGLAALCSHIKQCNTALGDLSEATANGFEETDDILHEKQDVTAAVSFTIPVDGWGEDDSSPGYFYCDIPIAGLLATDIVDVTVLPEFYDVAGAVGFIATESLEGKLRLRAAKAPTEKISAQYHITSTVKYTAAQEGGT